MGQHIFSLFDSPKFARALGIIRSYSLSSPRSLLIEGGDEYSRFLLAVYWVALGRCLAESKPCGMCSGCLGVLPLLQAQEEYSAIEKKDKMDGVYFSIADIEYFDSSSGLYTAQIGKLKQTMADTPKYATRYVLFMEMHKTHSLKEISNATLKTIEEPRDASAFVITVPERNMLLPTIVSRSWVITLPWQCSSDISISTEWVVEFAQFLTTGRGWFSKVSAKNVVLTVEDCEMVLRACAVSLCQAVRKKHTNELGAIFVQYPLSVLHQCMQELEIAEQRLRANVSTAIVLDTLVLGIYNVLFSTA